MAPVILQQSPMQQSLMMDPWCDPDGTQIELAVPAKKKSDMANPHLELTPNEGRKYEYGGTVYFVRHHYCQREVWWVRRVRKRRKPKHDNTTQKPTILRWLEAESGHNWFIWCPAMAYRYTSIHQLIHLQLGYLPVCTSVLSVLAQGNSVGGYRASSLYCWQKPFTSMSSNNATIHNAAHLKFVSQSAAHVFSKLIGSYKCQFEFVDII